MITTLELGKHLSRCRHQRKMSLRDVAAETGVSASTLSRMENGVGEVDARTVSVIAGYLDLPIERARKNEQFVYRKDEPLPQVVDALIRSDARLTEFQRDRLSALFAALHQALTENGKNLNS